MEQCGGQVVVLAEGLATRLYLDSAVQGEFAVQLMRLLLALAGIATYYTGPVGAPLYCDDGSGCVYDLDTPAWVALSEHLYESGWANCGDRIKVLFEDGRFLVATAMDAGPLQNYHLEQSPELPLLVDIPEHLWSRGTRSAEVKIINLTPIRERFEELTQK